MFKPYMELKLVVFCISISNDSSTFTFYGKYETVPSVISKIVLDWTFVFIENKPTS